MLKQLERLQRTIRLGLRLKLTLPYVALALAVAVVGAYFASRLIFDSLQDRFVYQLQSSGRLVSEAVVEIENEQLDTLRAIAHTAGVAEAVAAGDAGTLRAIVLPLSVNRRADLVDVLDTGGQAVLSLARSGSTSFEYDVSQGAGVYADWPVVQRVLAGESDELGDKFVALAESPWGPALYIAGPIYLRQELVGVALVGIRLDQLVQQLLLATGSYVTIYDPEGAVLTSALPDGDADERALTPDFYRHVQQVQDDTMPTRSFSVGEVEYGEVFGPFEARGGEDLALFSAALEPNIIVRASPITQAGLAVVVAVLFLFVILIGTMLARSITRHLLSLVHASQRVAQGDLSPDVRVRTGDEVEELATSFNEMVRQLREASRMQDIFGRTVSPQVAEELLRKGLELGGETREVTVLFSDIRGFSTISEYQSPQEIVAWINEYMTEMELAIRGWGGVITRFVGDAIVATFNAPGEQPDHPHRAVRAALAMCSRLDNLNRLRADRGDAPICHGIGIGTGRAVAGRIGSPDRAEYTVIGDAVNVASRLQDLTKQYQDQGMSILAPSATVERLEQRDDLDISDLGEVQVKGREQPVRVYGISSKDGGGGRAGKAH